MLPNRGGIPRIPVGKGAYGNGRYWWVGNWTKMNNILRNFGTSKLFRKIFPEFWGYNKEFQPELLKLKTLSGIPEPSIGLVPGSYGKYDFFVGIWAQILEFQWKSVKFQKSDRNSGTFNRSSAWTTIYLEFMSENLERNIPGIPGI